MEKRTMVCINCPLGCTLQVEIEDDQILVTGNSCKKGIDYAQNEIKAPKRTITSTMKVINGDKPVVSVKTNSDIPKKLIMEIMKEINTKTISAPIKIGDILIENVLNTGSNIVATTNVKKLC